MADIHMASLYGGVLLLPGSGWSTREDDALAEACHKPARQYARKASGGDNRLCHRRALQYT